VRICVCVCGGRIYFILFSRDFCGLLHGILLVYLFTWVFVSPTFHGSFLEDPEPAVFVIILVVIVLVCGLRSVDGHIYPLLLILPDLFLLHPYHLHHTAECRSHSLLLSS